jgi:hypothetical protein
LARNTVQGIPDRSCSTIPCDQYRGAVLASRHVGARLTGLTAQARKAETVSLDATSYCQGTVTASGQAPYIGEVANNMWPLGTRIEVSPAVFGRRYFRVEDRIGWGSSLDFFNPSCSAADEFGRRVERVTVLDS